MGIRSNMTSVNIKLTGSDDSVGRKFNLDTDLVVSDAKKVWVYVIELKAQGVAIDIKYCVIIDHQVAFVADTKAKAQEWITNQVNNAKNGEAFSLLASEDEYSIVTMTQPELDALEED